MKRERSIGRSEGTRTEERRTDLKGRKNDTPDEKRSGGKMVLQKRSACAYVKKLL